MTIRPILLLLLFIALPLRPTNAASPDFERAKEALDAAQRDSFRYIWDFGEPNSGMAYEANYDWQVRPVAVGGSGFGIAAIVVAADRGWVDRDVALERLTKIVGFLKDKTPRKELHGAFPHWLNGETGEAIRFGHNDDAADLVETSLLLQGLLIARAYFNGPGPEKTLRDAISEIWRDVDWNWFTNGEENGLYWHWDPEFGFNHGLKILGYNECLITYVLAISSPTHPISRKAYDYWTSGSDYLPKDVRGYRVEASQSGGGPLFMSQYSFIGLDPRQMADAYVKEGYFVRSVRQTLSNRDYCLYGAPKENRYDESFWGLTACRIPDGYAACSPDLDMGVVAPTAALSAFPFTPWQSLQVLLRLSGEMRERVWGEYGPRDGVSLRDDWVSEDYLAIDQLPIACMIENYRSGLLWNLLMSDGDIRAGLVRAGIGVPEHGSGFPELVGPGLGGWWGGQGIAGAVDVIRHPDRGNYEIPFWSADGGEVGIEVLVDGEVVHEAVYAALKGRGVFVFDGAGVAIGEEVMVRMREGEKSVAELPIRLR